MSPVDVRAAEDPWATAVLLHPHPDFGGSRFNVVVDSLFRALPEAGATAVRFDFSSSNEATSAGEAACVVDSLPTGPIVVIGYSFGAGVAARVTSEQLAGWFLIAYPLAMGQRPPIADDPRPKAVAVPQFDQFSPPAEVRRDITSWTNTTIQVVPGADHFLGDGISEVVSQVLSWLPSAVKGGRGDDRSLPTSS